MYETFPKLQRLIIIVCSLLFKNQDGKLNFQCEILMQVEIVSYEICVLNIERTISSLNMAYVYHKCDLNSNSLNTKKLIQ